jgi:hypothetical protein
MVVSVLIPQSGPPVRMPTVLSTQGSQAFNIFFFFHRTSPRTVEAGEQELSETSPKQIHKEKDDPS